MHKHTIVQHRTNTIVQLQQVPQHYGVELDIRDKYEKLIVAHDAFSKGTSWNDYITAYQHQLFIANIKTEGVEQKVITDLATAGIENYFLLDVSLPFMVKLTKQGFSKMAIRYSEYEPLELAQNFAGKVDWVWVDCFTKNVLDVESYNYLKRYFKICIVSPELQQHNSESIAVFKQQLITFEIDAVCTKQPEFWV